MTGPVLVLGGYGNFGKRIATALAATGCHIIIAGRRAEPAKALRKTLNYPHVETACFDADRELAQVLESFAPSVVINTCGPFQGRDYRIAEQCIDVGTHYIDLADGREFVCGINRLDARAKASRVAVISGASTVPALSSAVIEHFKHEFSQIKSLRYGITPGQRTEGGQATVESILSYLGRAIHPAAKQDPVRYGWQDLHRQRYPVLGSRWMANCDIPDLDLFPRHYDVQSVRFSAGLESSTQHLTLWILSWLIRAGLPIRPHRVSRPLLNLSHWFDRFGSSDGGMHIHLVGHDHQNRPHTRSWFLVALDGDGPQIPATPAVLLTQRLLNGDTSLIGARPCLGLISLEHYLTGLSDCSIQTWSHWAPQ